MKKIIPFLCLLMFACGIREPRQGFLPPKAFYYARDYYSPDRPLDEEYLKEFNERLVKSTSEIIGVSFQEPSLYELSNDSSIHCYRFLWLRSFHRYVALRLVIEPMNTATLVIKVSDRTGTSTEIGHLIENRSQDITGQQVKDFLTRLENIKFWTLSNYDGRMGLDGASWLLEGVKDGQYKMVARWSPDDEAYRAAALFLLELSGLQGEEIY